MGDGKSNVNVMLSVAEASRMLSLIKNVITIELLPQARCFGYADVR